MYGASKSTHRVDDVVSGRITPICRLLAPLVPAAASDLNWDIVDAMSTVKELMPSPAGTVTEAGAVVDAPADEDDDEDDAGVVEDDVHAAAIRAAAPTTATPPNRERSLFLLPSSIPYTFRRNECGYADAGHRRTRVSLRAGW